jgi:hypothetical protein
MTIQTTNIDATTGDAVDLTSSNEVFFTIADNVFLESQFANGVVAESGQSSFIYNNGGIVANGDGVILENSNDHFYNEPSGTVFGFRGVEMTTTGETFVNYSAVSGDVYGAEDTGGDNVISNYGTIEGPTAGLNIAAGGDTIANSTTGTIGGGITIASGGQTIMNAGAIEGNVTFTGTANSNPNSLWNFGDIFGSVTLGAAGNTTIDNFGTIIGAGGTAISLGSGPNDVVNNDGIINGNVMLGNGAHAVYNGTAGQIIGDIFAGSGGDTIFAGSGPTTMIGGSGTDALIGGAGTDAIFAGTGNDYIQAGSGTNFIGFETSNIIANHFDNVANFGPNTYLTLPAADVSTTAFVAFNGGTLVGVPVGGAFFGVFVSGVAPSAVQAHTIFNL